MKNEYIVSLVWQEVVDYSLFSWERAVGKAAERRNVYSRDRSL
jgi:hypothetical protein